jgi:hypothetical protein
MKNLIFVPLFLILTVVECQNELNGLYNNLIIIKARIVIKTKVLMYLQYIYYK